MKQWLSPLLYVLLGIALSAVFFLISSPPRGTGVTLLPVPTPAPILVHVDGAVNHPGVYPLPRDSRVQDAITAAGGMKPDAQASAVNLAGRLRDGEKLIVPIVGSVEAPPAQANQPLNEAEAPQPAPTPGIVNVNTATEEELDTLPGIGPALAAEIIRYREAQGGFTAPEQLLNVPGIGPAKFEKIQDMITLD
jgi:competence protein ComEA